MPTMDPGKALATGEQALRQLLSFVLPTALGPDWLTKVTKAEQLERWQSRRGDESAKRGPKGAAVVPENDLAYAEFYELIAIAEKQWSHIGPALGKWKDTGALLGRMEDLRNTVGHSRELLPFEADLLSGIAGELRNRVTIYMSSKDPGGEYYPRIESVTDQFGHTSEATFAAASHHLKTNFSVPFGSTIRFQCRATDPQGRDITWSITSNAPTKRIKAVGDDVEVDWTFDTPAEVGDRSPVTLMIHSSSQYHRTPSFDDYFEFTYRVTPPPVTD